MAVVVTRPSSRQLLQERPRSLHAESSSQGDPLQSAIMVGCLRVPLRGTMMRLLGVILWACAIGVTLKGTIGSYKVL